MMIVLVTTVILLTVSVIVACESPTSTLRKEEYSSSHIVFFGDSLIRYQYLAYVYKLHFHTSIVPGFMINEKLFNNWNSFFENTTAVFGGAMTCDCYREASVKRLSTARENRRYIHPSGSLVVSYYPLMGYNPIQGMNSSSAVIKSFGKLRTTPDWFYASPFSFVQQHLSREEPIPSVVFVNSGHWNHKQIAKNPRKLLAMLEDVVLSPRSTGIMINPGHHDEGAIAPSPTPAPTPPAAAGKCVAWLGTTRPNMAWWAGSRDADWNIIRGKYCWNSLAHTHNVGKEKELMLPAEEESELNMMKVSVFVPFRVKVNESDYFDHMHFSNESVYHLRTDSALEACNLQNSLYSL